MQGKCAVANADAMVIKNPSGKSLNQEIIQVVSISNRIFRYSGYSEGLVFDI